MKYALLTKHELKIAWILAKFFFMDLGVVEVHKNAEKERGQYPAILSEQAWSIKDLFISPKDYTKEVRLREQSMQSLLGKMGLPWIRFILPARGASHIII